MANLPTGLVSGQNGHVAWHEDLHRRYNARRQSDYALHDSAERVRLIPRFTKYTTAGPLLAEEQTAIGGAYWPWVLRVDGILSAPLDRYYMWFSTDHAPGAGGIGLATAPAPTGPWTDRGLVYVDTVQGEETETPSVVWNEATSEFYMYYQQLNLGNLQSTALAKSPDGVTWTRYGKVIDTVDTDAQPGDGHTGYFRPFRVGNMWYGYSLLGGGDPGAFGLWASADGVTWHHDPRRLGWAADQFPADKRLSWNHSTVVHWRGQRWMFTTEASFGSGGTPGEQKAVMLPLADDLRHTIGKPIYFNISDRAWENNSRAGMPYPFVDDDGKLYVYYYASDAIGLTIGE